MRCAKEARVHYLNKMRDGGKMRSLSARDEHGGNA